MSQKAIETQGTKLEVGQTAGKEPVQYTAVTNINGFRGPDGSASEIEVTDFDSVAKEFKLGLPDEGNITVDGYWVPSDKMQAFINQQKKARKLTHFRIALTDAEKTKIEFTAYVSAFNLEAAQEDVWKVSITLRVTGEVKLGNG